MKKYPAILEAFLAVALLIGCSSENGTPANPTGVGNGQNEDFINKDGVLFDSRDGQIYRVVTIGAQTWMAQNLAYETYDCEYFSGCIQCGRLYSRPDAYTVCPSGWHLPSSSEWEMLYKNMGESPYAMQAQGFEEWPNATDAYNFSVLPVTSYSRLTASIISGTSFWSSTVSGSGNDANSYKFYYWNLQANGAGVFSIDDAVIAEYSFLSVRCVKD